MNSLFTAPLHDLDSSRVAEAGGKGASLGELMRAGAPVPPGFAVLSPAFDMFLATDNCRLQVGTILDHMSQGKMPAKEAVSEIRALLTSIPVPALVAEAIATAQSHLNVELVSVRSSATCEDSGASAWAGQLETYLNIAPDQVIDRVRECWLSLFRESALAYGAAHGYGGGHFSVAVVVQQMVPSQISGIGFSVHPVTQEPNVLLIEACLGQGEAIVSGRIVPDQYSVERGTNRVLNSIVGNQKEGLFLQPQGVAEWQTLGEAGNLRKLADAQVVQYLQMLAEIDDH